MISRPVHQHLHAKIAVIEAMRQNHAALLGRTAVVQLPEMRLQVRGLALAAAAGFVPGGTAGPACSSWGGTPRPGCAAVTGGMILIQISCHTTSK
jgi:hypothetical protein